MTIDRFHGVVLMLANQMFVRFYLALDHPEYKRMGLQFLDPVDARLRQELRRLGFVWNLKLKMWIVDRTGA